MLGEKNWRMQRKIQFYIVGDLIRDKVQMKHEIPPIYEKEN